MSDNESSKPRQPVDSYPSAAFRKRHHDDDAKVSGSELSLPPPLLDPQVASGSGGGRPCAVCGDITEPASGDAGCCDSCKAFFRRCAVGGQELGCIRGDNACKITVANRKQCRACRYQCCLRAGLRQSPPPHQQQQQQHQTPPIKRQRSDGFAGSSASSGGGGSSSSVVDFEIPTKPVDNWKDALLKVVNYYGEDRTQIEGEFLAQIGNILESCTSADMSVPFELSHDLSQGLSEQLNDWKEMISQLEIFIQPAVSFCKTFLATDFFKQMTEWRPEHSVLLVKRRIHSVLVPLFSLKFDPSKRQMSVSIDGKTYSVDPNKSIRNLDRSFMPGLSAVSSNDRYFEYIHKVTGGDVGLIALFTLMKLFDLSSTEKDELPEDIEQLAFDMFMRLAKVTRHAFIAKFDDRWQPKMRELCILFEWSKTFEESLSKLFASLSSQSPTPLFAEIYT
ncbi:hypothetical protein BOX15_Mlig000392g1 [Macrostomum lignano]|uniref:Nuclear receptor domain-containing protein n=1 Tax=Macrostomum lignano TaxID=282301 RepID=A0A267EE67_9PLAT|nr:hypothetical protein BOX15_Mlig000392g1 [Macrostomum lignano]